MDIIMRMRAYLSNHGAELLILAVLFFVPVRLLLEIALWHGKPDSAVILFSLGFLAIAVRLTYTLFTGEQPRHDCA